MTVLILSQQGHRRDRLKFTLPLVPALLLILLVFTPRPNSDGTPVRVSDASEKVLKLSQTLDVGAQIEYFALSPDGKVIAAVVDHSVQLWAVGSRRRLQTFVGFEKAPGLSWSPDSSRLLLTKWGNGAAVWFAHQDPAELQVLPLRENLRITSWSPDSRFLLTTHPRALADVWDMQKLTLRFELKLKKDLTDARWSPNCSSVMTVAKDRGWKAQWKFNRSSLVQVWDAETGAEKFTIRLRGPVEKVEFNADGKYILTAGSWEVPELWDAVTGSLHAKMNPPWCRHENCGTHYAELSRDGMIVAIGSGVPPRKEIWDVASGKFVASVETEQRDDFLIIGLSPNGRLLAVYREHFKSWKSFAEESSIQLYDTSNGKLHVALTGKNMMWSAQQFLWSSDSQTLVTAGGSHGYQGKIWDVKTGRLRADLSLIAKEGYFPFVGSYLKDLDLLTFHPTEPLLIGTSLNLVKLWNPENGELLQTILTADAKWSKDGGLLVTTSADQKSLQLWGIAH